MEFVWALQHAMGFVVPPWVFVVVQELTCPKAMGIYYAIFAPGLNFTPFCMRFEAAAL